MKLTDAKVKAARLAEGQKQLRFSDGGGLYLQLIPSGKYCRINYLFGGKQRTLAIGVYPSVSLKEARDKRAEAKKLLEQNIDPSQAKQQERREQRAQSRIESFETVAKEWMGVNRDGWSASHMKRVDRLLNKETFPWIGSLPVDQIHPADVLAVLRRAESRGHNETAHRLRTLCGQVFRYAVATARINSDPSRDLKGALKPVVPTHMPTITEPKKVGQLLRDIEGFEGTFVVQCALKLTPYLFVRPGELRKAEWSEIDLEAAEWRLPAEKMKMRRIHIVPLADQCVAILREIQALSGNGRYVFPSIRDVRRPMSENTINVALRRLGYEKGEICAHGFRGMASTILHEQGWPTDVIERQLAHQEGNEVKRSYNHARHLPDRKKMMQQWADYLDGLRAGADVIPIGRANG